MSLSDTRFTTRKDTSYLCNDRFEITSGLIREYVWRTTFTRANLLKFCHHGKNQGLLPANVVMSTACVIFLALVLAALGCSKKEQEEIKVGVITPLTGEGARYGEATKKGVDLAVEEINRQGSISGKKIRVIYEDDQIKSDVGVNAIQKLIAVDRVPVILGAFDSSVTLAIAPIAEKNKVVLFSASSTADAIKDAGDYIFRNVPPNSRQGKTAAEFAVAKLKAKTAAILYTNNDYGSSLAKALERSFREKGGSVVITENYNPDDPDFRTQLSKIRATQPSVIFYPGHYQESGLIIRQAKEMGIESVFVGGDESYSPELIKIAGDASEGSYYTLLAMGYGVADEKIRNFAAAFKNKYKDKPDVYSAYAYDALKIIALAIGKGGYNADGIKNALYQIRDFKGVTGITSFDKFGEVDKPFYIYEVKHGKFALLKNQGGSW